MKKIAARIGLSLVSIGLFIMSFGDKSQYDDQDKEMLKELHKLKYDFEESLKWTHRIKHYH